MSNTEPTKNLLLEAATRKAAIQASGKKTGIMGKDISKRFLAPGANRAPKPTSRGGRNGQGKP